MKKYHINTILCCFIILLSSLAVAKKDETSHKATPKYQEIIWEQLIPEEDLKILLNPPDSIWEIEDGSPEDTLDGVVSKTEANNNGAMSEAEGRYRAALKSFNVVKDFDNKGIRLPGFIVPLVTNEKNQVTEFFIVPYFGACLHKPPPPPNQIIFAKLDKGYELTSLYQPFWFEGKITISTHNNALGDSAYKLDVQSVVAYDPFAEFE